MRFKEFLEGIDDAQSPGATQPAPTAPQRPLKPARPLTGRDLMKKVSMSDLSDQDQANVERALAGQMNRPLKDADISRVSQRSRIDLSSLLGEAEEQKFKDFHQWMQACKDAHPDFAAQMRFKIDGEDHVAYVRGMDRIFGVWTGDDDGEGMVLEGSMKEAGEDLIYSAIAKLPRGNMHKDKYIIELITLVKHLDKNNLFKGDDEAIESMIRTALDL